MIIKRTIGEKGQVVIPKDIRELLGLKRGNDVVFEVKDNEVVIKQEEKESPEEILKRFFTRSRTKGKDLTLEDLRRIEDESYDIP